MTGFAQPGAAARERRLPASAKLGLLAAAVTALALLTELWMLGAAAALTLLLALVRRVPLGLWLGQIAPILWILAVAVPVHAIFSGWESAATMALRIITAVALAGLFTLTTPVADVLDAVGTILRPFRRWIDADRVGLAIALAIRSIPLLGEIVQQVLEARRARGAERSLRAIAVPVIVRALQTADELGEALAARGVDD